MYVIKNFIVEEYTGKYRHVHNPQKILFTSTTLVSKIDRDYHSIPQYQFELADYETIVSRCLNTNYLTGNSYYYFTNYFTQHLLYNLTICPQYILLFHASANIF